MQNFFSKSRQNVFKANSTCKITQNPSVCSLQSFSTVAVAAAAAMGEGCRGTTKPKAPKPPKDEAYLESVIEKRIRFFESIKAQQNEARKNIADETIRY